ncbi:inosine-uridine preferring nucleoside hydrolase [Lichtheimia corymbifera JMRC:FSU:9682]|uniref:Inosine-uridine preferring nucleoside hydrolase n=1 Tax=Lichtheimia corymbifera JMRC:FSU:9682 TaxID=1263082 RepID=A0A068S4W5_9FUNG|nr:inosine-uridine preferring nucleoside hydrolase [Lichtheimia corymbifera JMRC:FSU:9682]
MTITKESVILDTDPGIDDALAMFYLLMNPKVKLTAVTLTHGNTNIDHVKRNAETVLHVMRKQRESLNQEVPVEELPVLAIGSATPLKANNLFATYFHGVDGMGDIYSKNSYWEDLAREGKPAYQTTERDAADEILHQLKHADPLSISILAVGPLTNIALAYQRDPVTFSRAKRVVVMGGAVDTPGNVTPMAEFNFRADPDAADIVMGTSKGFKHSPEGYSTRLELIEQGKQAPMHVVVLPLSSEGAISKQEYQERIVPVKTPVGELCNAFLVWTFEVCSKLYNIETLCPYDAYTALLLVDMISDKGDGKNESSDFDQNWVSRYLDLHVETKGEYTLGMSCYDNRGWDLDEPAWGDEQAANHVQVIVRGNGPRFARIFLDSVFAMSVQ